MFHLEILKDIHLEDPSVDSVGGCGVDSSGLVQWPIVNTVMSLRIP
jgi:hypothetical protein